MRKGRGDAPRPPHVSPYYSGMSLAMANQFNAALKGDKTVEEALDELQNIADQG
jgi:hypothetical protein